MILMVQIHSTAVALQIYLHLGGGEQLRWQTTAEIPGQSSATCFVCLFAAGFVREKMKVWILQEGVAQRGKLDLLLYSISG